MMYCTFYSIYVENNIVILHTSWFTCFQKKILHFNLINKQNDYDKNIIT